MMSTTSFPTLVVDIATRQGTVAATGPCPIDVQGALDVITEAITSGMARLDDDATIELTRRGRRFVAGLARRHRPPVPAGEPSANDGSWAGEAADLIMWEHRVAAAVEATLSDTLGAHRRAAHRITDGTLTEGAPTLTDPTAWLFDDLETVPEHLAQARR